LLYAREFTYCLKISEEFDHFKFYFIFNEKLKY
jgi:hypothetical protein